MGSNEVIKGGDLRKGCIWMGGGGGVEKGGVGESIKIFVLL